MKDILKSILNWLLKMAGALLDNLNSTLKTVGLPTLTKNRIATAVAKELGKQTISRGMGRVFSFAKKLNPLYLYHKIRHQNKVEVGESPLSLTTLWKEDTTGAHVFVKFTEQT